MTIRTDAQKTSLWIVLSVVVILSIGLVTYHPSLSIGFWTDDYTFLEGSARASFPQGLVQAFDPFAQVSWYRPLQVIQWLIEYRFFGGNPMGYHAVNVAIHFANCILLLGLVTRVTRKWWVGLAGALAFLSLSTISIDVFWPAVADPLATFFYLAAMSFWLTYLQTEDRSNYILASVALVATLLTKEMGATLIAALVLMDRLLVNGPATFTQLSLRYLPLLGALIPYALIEYYVSSRGVYVNLVAYRVSEQMLVNLSKYSQWLLFPWNLDFPIASLLVAAALVYFIAVKRNRALLFLTLAACIAMLPVLAFPFALARYLYLPASASAVLTGLGFESLRTRWQDALGRAVIVSGMVALAFVWSSATLFESAFNYAEFVRATRAQFRPIFQRHATFQPDTLLYFIQPPFPTTAISGMMYLRYGEHVSVYGTDRDRVAGLGNHKAGFVYYFDDQETLQEAPVEHSVVIQAAPVLPVQFSDSISLEAFELASADLKGKGAIALILYWLAEKHVERDYTVFIHLINANGEIVASVDEQPKQGTSPTSAWPIKILRADGHVVPLDEKIPAGEYKLEVGLYDLATMQRLLLVDTHGAPIGDKVVIEPIRVTDAQ